MQKKISCKYAKFLNTLQNVHLLWVSEHLEVYGSYCWIKLFEQNIVWYINAVMNLLRKKLCNKLKPITWNAITSKINQSKVSLNITTIELCCYSIKITVRLQMQNQINARGWKNTFEKDTFNTNIEIQN